MQNYHLVFQMGHVEYLVGNMFYTAKVTKIEREDKSTQYSLVLEDKALVDRFGANHEYYYNPDGFSSFHIGGDPALYDLHIPVFKALDKIHWDRR